MAPTIKEVRRFVGGALFAVFACVSGAAAQEKARPAGELNLGLSGLSSETLDPILGGLNVKFYLGLVYDYIIGMDAKGNLSKDTGIAKDWKSSPDKTRWTFYLRDGARFHNGDPVTSEDVKFTITRAMSKRSTTGYADVLRDLVAGIDTPNPHEVVVTTKAPTVFLLQALSGVVSSDGMVVPKKYIEANGDNYFAQHPIGSGPYKAVEHVPGSYIRLEAAGRHWRAGTPKYKDIYVRLVSEENTRVAMLRQGKLDIIDISADRMPELKKEGIRILLKENDALVTCWWLESWANSPIGKTKVREALNLAIDRKEIAETIFSGLARPAYVPLGFSWAFPQVGFKPGKDVEYAFDPERARKLLAEAGYPNGFDTTILSFPIQGFPHAATIVQAIAGYWGNIGVRAQVASMDYGAARKKWFDRSAPGSLACFNLGNRNEYGQYAALTKFTAFSKPTGTMHDPEIDRLVAALGKETDSRKFDELMTSAYRRLRSESLGVSLVDIHTPYAIGKSLPAWDLGNVMYEMNLEQILREK